MKFHVITFGCQMNVHDSTWLVRAMEARGWTHAAEDEAAVFVINTCSVREKPEQKVYSVLGRLERQISRTGGFAAVGGCVGQQIGREFFSRFPFVRLVFGTDGVAKAPSAMQDIAGNRRDRVALLDFMAEYPERELSFDQARLEAGGRSAFVNIMQGCDNFCSYCIVPFTRGRQKSRHPDAVLDEVGQLARAGVREVTLLGQNVNSFGMDKAGAGVSFAELLHKVAAVQGVERIRFTTSHPKDIAEEVIEAFGCLENLCPHLHLPMQAGSDRVLKKMGRRYDRERYMDIVDRLRQARPDMALTTDIIVAFPGETEQDFVQTLEMVERVGFESSFSFKYSDRPGTAAERLTPKVDPAEAQDRLERLQNLQNRLTRESLKNCVGKSTSVLLEGKSRRQESEGTSWRGRDPHARVVNVAVSSYDVAEGSIVPVRILEAKKHSLIGERAGEPW